MITAGKVPPAYLTNRAGDGPVPYDGWSAVEEGGVLMVSDNNIVPLFRPTQNGTATARSQTSCPDCSARGESCPYDDATEYRR